MDKKDHSQDYDVGEKSDNRRKQYSQRNWKEQHKREGNYPSIGKGRWNNIHGRENFFFCSLIYYMVFDCSLWQTIYNK